MTNSKGDLPPCLIYIDKEGRWYHKGTEIIRRDIIRLFYQNIVLDSQNRYVIAWNETRCYVEVEDTAFVVRRVVFRHENHAQPRFILYINDDAKEDLSPETLYVGKDNVLYCKVKNRSFPARFNRPAYYQLAEYIEEDDETYYLPINGKRYILSFSKHP